MKSSYQSTAWLPKDEYDGINAELLKETLVYAFSILAGACNEKSCTSESGLPATVFDPELELRSNSLALQMPSCPRPSQCSRAVAHVTFELKLVGINRNDFDHENYKDGLVNFFNSFLPANIINAAARWVEACKSTSIGGSTLAGTYLHSLHLEPPPGFQAFGGQDDHVSCVGTCRIVGYLCV